MVVLTGREFRTNQAKYFSIANSGEEVVVKSHIGVFRIVPIAKRNEKSDGKRKGWEEMLDRVGGAWKDISMPEDFRTCRTNKDEDNLISILRS